MALVMGKILSLFNTLRRSAKKNSKKLIISFLAFVLFVLLFFESGVALYSHISSRYKILVLIGILALAVGLLFLLFDYSRLIEKAKGFFASFKSSKHKAKTAFEGLKSLSPEFFLVSILLLALVLSFLLNKNRSDNTNGYLMFISVLVLSFLLTKTFTLEQFSKAFVRIMTFICVASILINAFYLIADVDLGNSIFSTANGSSRISTFFGIFIRNITNNSVRMAGPFWEPGVYSTMSLVAVALYHFFVDKKKLIIPIVLSVGIVFSQSSAGLLLMVFLWAIIGLDFLKNAKVRMGLSLALFGALALLVIGILIPQIMDFLIRLFPSVFGKFRTISFVSRYYSFLYGFKIFFTSPLFGVGPTTARDLFFSMTAADGITVDAFTSTAGMLVASYGIAGLIVFSLPILGIFLSRQTPLELKLLLALFYFLLTLQESQIEIFMLFILYLMLGFVGIRKRIKRFETNGVFSISDEKSCLLNLFFKKDEKGNVSSNIAINAVIKVLTLLVGFVTISVYSGYFENKSAYGIWLSIISVSTWILQLDFGFGNSLRNKLTEARVAGDPKREQAVLSSTYLVTLIMTIIWIGISVVLCNVLDLFSVFKASPDYVSAPMLKVSVLIVLISIAVELSLRNVTYVLQVIGKSGVASSLTLISNILILIFASVFHVPGETKFLVLSIAYSSFILLPLIVASIVVFSKRIVPFVNFRSVTKESLQDVSKLGVGFFVVQLSNLFLWSLNDLLLINLLNRPDVVVDYTEYYKIFTAITGLAMIMQGPVWVGISGAQAEKNFEKFKKYCRLNLAFCLFLAFCSLVLTFALPLVFNIWLGEGEAPEVRIIYQIIMVVFSFVTCGYQYFGLICNGLGIVKSQAIVASAAAILKIPLVLLLNFWFGAALQWSSVILANTLLIAVYIAVLPFSIRKATKRMRNETPDKRAGGAE